MKREEEKVESRKLVAPEPALSEAQKAESNGASEEGKGGSEKGEGGSEKGEGGEVPSLAGVLWQLEPPILDVMRDTTVELSAKWEDVPESDYSCVWDPGDRSGTLRGCRRVHTFVNGLADRTITLKMLYRGHEVLQESRELRLERLPVQEFGADPRMLPPAPEAEGSQRVAFLGLGAVPGAGEVETLVGALKSTGVTFGFLFFNYDPAPKEAKLLLTALNAGSTTVVPLYCGGSAMAALPWVNSSRVLLHGDDNQPPFREAFLVAGTLFVVLDSRVRENSREHEKWLLKHLEKGKMAAHRVAVSCRPLESFVPSGGGELHPQFRYYEKLLRGDVSLLVSSTDPVFYHGMYGAIPAVSAGCVSGVPGRLRSSDVEQENLLTLIDLRPSRRPSVFAVLPGVPQEPVDTLTFPMEVGNYVRVGGAGS